MAHMNPTSRNPTALARLSLCTPGGTPQYLGYYQLQTKLYLYKMDTAMTWGCCW